MKYAEIAHKTTGFAFRFPLSAFILKLLSVIR